MNGYLEKSKVVVLEVDLEIGFLASAALLNVTVVGISR